MRVAPGSPPPAPQRPANGKAARPTQCALHQATQTPTTQGHVWRIRTATLKMRSATSLSGRSWCAGCPRPRSRQRGGQSASPANSWNIYPRSRTRSSSVSHLRSGRAACPRPIPRAADTMAATSRRRPPPVRGAPRTSARCTGLPSPRSPTTCKGQGCQAHPARPAPGLTMARRAKGASHRLRLENIVACISASVSTSAWDTAQNAQHAP